MILGLQLIALMLLQPQNAQHLADPRIQTHGYNKDAVVNLAVSPGYAAVVELASDEQIDTVVIGNGNGWQITETAGGNRLVVKPLSGAAPTNMVVITDARRYVFDLDPGGSPDRTSFVLRFDYPGNEAAASRQASSYKFSGDRQLFPVAMRDDGQRTRVRWGKETPMPAIVAIGDGQAETLVNGRMVGNEYVIEGTAERYKFRYGTAEAVAVRRPVKRSSR